MLIVSKCLAGYPCRCDGGDNLAPELRALAERGEDVTEAFRLGAARASRVTVCSRGCCSTRAYR